MSCIGSEVGRDVLPLAGGHIDLDEAAAAAARTISNAIDDVWIFRIGSIDAEFRRRHRAPVSEVHLSPVAAARDHYGAGVLLRTHDVVGICAVGGYVVDLRNDLGVPEAPGAAVVQRDARALVGADQHAVAVRGVNPELVVVLTAGRALEGLKGEAAIGRAVHGGAHGVHNVRILRVHEHAAAIIALAVADPHGDPQVVPGHVLPGGATIVGAVKSRALFNGIADDVHALALGVHGDGDRNAAREGRNLDLGPGLALIRGLEHQGRLASRPATAAATAAAGRRRFPAWRPASHWGRRMRTGDRARHRSRRA